MASFEPIGQIKFLWLITLIYLLYITKWQLFASFEARTKPQSGYVASDACKTSTGPLHPIPTCLIYGTLNKY